MVRDAYTRQISDTLSAEDRTSIASALSRMPIADFAKNLLHLLRGWRSLVEAVEQGYDLSVYEYLNDVSSRRILERALQAVQPQTAERLMVLLQPLDARFLAATVQTDLYLGAGIVHLDDPPRLREHPHLLAQWYYTRVPRAPGAELANDLKGIGIDPRPPSR